MAATNKCLAHFNKSGMQAKATKKCVADITATDLARPNGPPPHHALAALEDRSMSEESNRQCSICFRRYTEFGHPAVPVESGRCCNVCNDLVVIPARLRAAREATVAPLLTAVSEATVAPLLTAVSEAIVAPPALTAVSEDHKVVCSFCGKSNLQTKLMVAAPADSNSNAVICNDCIAVCVKIEREQDERKVAEAGREMTVSGKAPRGRKAKKAGHVPSRL